MFEAATCAVDRASICVRAQASDRSGAEGGDLGQPKAPAMPDVESPDMAVELRAPNCDVVSAAANCSDVSASIRLEDNPARLTSHGGRTRDLVGAEGRDSRRRTSPDRAVALDRRQFTGGEGRLRSAVLKAAICVDLRLATWDDVEDRNLRGGQGIDLRGAPGL